MGFFLILLCAESEKKMCEGDNCVLNKAAKEEIVIFYEQLGKRHFDTSK